jgi:hypothetical protein
MRSPAIILVADTIPISAEEKGEGSNEHLQEHRARTKLGHGNGNGSLPSIIHLWAGTDLCRVGTGHQQPDPRVGRPGRELNPVLVLSQGTADVQSQGAMEERSPGT